MYSFPECQQKIIDELKKINLDKDPRELYEPINYILEIGGKRIRPALVLMACNVFSENIGNATNAALAIEIFHNFTLLHDDIMDNADMRRNKATVHKKWNENIAIISGDAMMILAYQFLSKYSPELFSKLFKIFNDTALKVCEGQQFDMNYETTLQVSIGDYLKMIELKTSVLIAASLKIGAIIGGASEDNADNIYEYGKNLGLAFQLQDDMLDAFGETEKFGKKTGGDIIANKKTYLLLKALEDSNSETKKELLEWLHKEEFDPSEKVLAVKKIYSDLNIAEKTQSKIDEYFEKSWLSLDKISVGNDKKSELQGFAKYLMKREN